MKIMVFDVPAENGGALTILNDFFEKYKTDTRNEYVFVVSKPNLCNSNNIIVLRYPWIKKSWFHRLYFDHIVAPRLIKKHKADQVISLQNMMISHTKVPQSVYIHNALPFSEYRFSLKEDKLLWFYQNIMSKCIFKSIIKASKIIVQTEWMKQKIIETLKVERKKIIAEIPKFDVKVNKKFIRTPESISTFFYPASGMVFKNHKTIIDACIKLKQQNIKNYKVVFTLSGNENKHIRNLSILVKKNDLPIIFAGVLSLDEVFDYYSRSTLIFSSFIETVGLPLIEARMHGTPVIVSDSYFSREVLGDYKSCSYFSATNPEELCRLMCKSLNSYT